MNPVSNIFRRSLLSLGLALLVSGLLNCSAFSRKISYPAYYAEPGTEQSLFTCTTVQKHRLWYMLYGSVSMGRPQPEQMFSTGRRVYRVVETKTGWDVTLSIVLGLLASVTTSSLEYQACDVRGLGPLPRNNPPAPQPQYQQPPAQQQYQQPQYQQPPAQQQYQQPQYQQPPAQQQYQQYQQPPAQQQYQQYQQYQQQNPPPQ